jgi:hypothetical protein
LTELGDSAVRISEAFGLTGASGGIKQLRLELVNLGTDSSGMINTFGKIYDKIVAFANGVQAALLIPMAALHFLTTGDLGTYKLTKIPSFADLMASNPRTTRPVTTQQAESMFAGSTISGAAGAAPASIPALPPKAAKAPKTVFEEGNAGGFENAGIGGVGPFGDIIFNVNGGDPNAVVEALRTYMRQNGSVPIKTSDAF